MNYFFLTSVIDWGNIAESGLLTLVVTAVFALIVKPLVQQLVDANAGLVKNIGDLNVTIPQGDSTINANIKQLEQSIVNSNLTNKAEFDSIKDKLQSIQDLLQKNS